MTFHSYISNPINHFIFDNYGPSPVQHDTIELRNLYHFVTNQKPIWIFTKYQTLSKISSADIGRPLPFVQLDHSFLWKEEYLDEHFERVMQARNTSTSSSEDSFDWDSHSPIIQRY